MNRTTRMKWKPRDLRACVAAVLLGLPACNQLEKIDENDSGGGGGVPAAVQLAFERSCGTSPVCHAAGGTSPTLEGAGIADLVGAPSSGSALPLLTLGDTANSYIAIKMLPDDVVAGLGLTRTGTRMPLGFNYESGNADTLADTRTILAWIGGADYPGGEETGSAEGTDTGDESSSGGPALEPTFANVQSEIITPNCFCHNAPPNPVSNGSLSLQEGMARANIVGVKSTQLTTMDLVKPGEPDASYFFLKVNGKYLDEGGIGDPMPIGGMLTPEQLLLLEEWITAGALDD